MNDHGALIHNRRKELHLTLDDIANAVGVTKSTVRKWEIGMIQNMGRDKIADLAKVLKVSPGLFIDNLADMEEETEWIVVKDKDEIRLIEYYRQMSHQCQGDILRSAEALAKTFRKENSDTKEGIK